MTTHVKPEVLMISISDNPISQYYKNRSVPTWESAGYTVRTFEAITPKHFDRYNYLHFGKKRGKIEFTPTEKAVWYSHIECWVVCRNTKPIIIVEHDVELVEDIDDEVFENDFVCLAHSNPNTKRKLPGGAYYLKPDRAAAMVQDAKRLKNITYNSDAFIHNQCDKYGVWDHTKCFQYQNPEIGFTIEHNK